jgi:hypothetical protein
MLHDSAKDLASLQVSQPRPPIRNEPHQCSPPTFAPSPPHVADRLGDRAVRDRSSRHRQRRPTTPPPSGYTRYDYATQIFYNC